MINIADSMHACLKEEVLVLCYYMYFQAIKGQAFDRHLLGLRTIAKEKGIEMPAIFTDPVYGKTHHFRLRTAQVRASYIILRLHTAL